MEVGVRKGWLLLGWFVAVAISACGDPTVTDIGSDDDDAVSGTNTPISTASNPTGTPTPVPSPTATVTGLPSFATYQSSIKPIQLGKGCGQCHSGGSGGLVINPGDGSTDNQSFYWGNQVCLDAASGSDRMVTFNPPSGRLMSYFCTAAGTTIGAGHEGRNFSTAECTTLVNWIKTGTANPPPPCP